MTNLKPCPFCGSDKIELKCLDNVIDIFVCECVVCKARTDRSSSEIAEYKWNRRANE